MLIDESDRVSTDTAASLPLFPLRDNAAYANESKTKLPLSTYFIIAIPAFLDVASTFNSTLDSRTEVPRCFYLSNDK